MRVRDTTVLKLLRVSVQVRVYRGGGGGGRRRGPGGFVSASGDGDSCEKVGAGLRRYIRVFAALPRLVVALLCARQQTYDAVALFCWPPLTNAKLCDIPRSGSAAISAQTPIKQCAYPCQQ